VPPFATTTGDTVVNAQRVGAALVPLADTLQAQAILSPVGLIDLFREYFFEFYTFLGAPTGQFWLSPGGTVEVIETSASAGAAFAGIDHDDVGPTYANDTTTKRSSEQTHKHTRTLVNDELRRKMRKVGVQAPAPGHPAELAGVPRRRGASSGRG
jgi:hypothetical protein